MKIRNKYLLKLIFDNINWNKKLEIIKYSKNIQKKIEIGINDYKKEYMKIEIEILQKKYSGKKEIKFINISNENKAYNHCYIYFNDNASEIKRNFYTGKDNISKIKIILDYNFKSFNKLFMGCEQIKIINFKKFKRNVIIDMNHMFANCTKLKEINFENFNTNNVNDLNNMFYYCASLKKLNLSNFNTNKVTNMSCMFNNCISLKKLDLQKFKTDNVTDMNFMF